MLLPAFLLTACHSNNVADSGPPQDSLPSRTSLPAHDARPFADAGAWPDASPRQDAAPLWDGGVGVSDGPRGTDGSSTSVDAMPCSTEGADLFAAPHGSGIACSCRSPCTLFGARDRARAVAAMLHRDLVVQLAGGTYSLDRTFVLEAADSGQHGDRIIYRAAPGQRSVLSGGVRITGFQPVGDGVYRAQLPAGLRSRQLFVGERRATRARGPDMPTGYTKQAKGFTLGSPVIASWPDRLGLEVVGFKDWKSFRCGVSAVSAIEGLQLTEPCWSYGQRQAQWSFDQVTWLENARELLDAPGEFYLDEQAGTLDYYPLPDEDLAVTPVVLPVLEELVRLAGSVAQPVHDLVFDGLTFSHATWLAPSGPDGYACLQAGITPRGEAGRDQKPLSHVTLHAAQRVRFTRCQFSQLGGVALALEVGSRDNVVERSRFEDISGSAVFVGDVTHSADHHPTDPAEIVRDNTVSGCYVTRTGAEYFDMAALFAGYTTHTTFAQNEIFDVPYTGISVGWGWGSADPGGSAGYTTATTSRDNVITRNVISHHMRRLLDGGAIYVLGAQPGSTISDNVISNQGAPYGNIYLDNGSTGWSVWNNLVLVPHKEGGADAQRSYWLYVQVYPTIARSNLVGLNFTDDPLLFTPRPIDPTNQLQTPLAASAAPPTLRDAAGSPLRSPNIALGKAVTASSTYDPGHSPGGANNDNAFDGWSPAGADRAAFWQVDLGAPHALDGIEVVTRWGYDQPDTRRNFRIRAAVTPEFTDAVVLGEVGTAPLPHRSIYAREFHPGVVARYVRIEKTAPEYFFLSEVRLHGTPAE